MAGRIRTVKPEWIDDEKMLLASPAARVLSIGLLVVADDYGRGVGNHDLIVSRIFPAHHSQGHKAVAELAELGYIKFYEVRGQTYFEIVNWRRHQKVDKPGKPRVPCRCGIVEKDHECPEKIIETPRNLLAQFATDHDHDHDHDHDQGPSRSAVSASDLECVYKSYPKKKAKKKGMDALKAKIRTADDLDALRVAVEAMAKAWSGEDTKFCPGWGPFCIGERWLDDELPMPAKQEAGQGAYYRPLEDLKPLVQS